MMIENGRVACFMKDKKGYLPAHVACSRHCSPEKLRMLLAVNPGSLYEKSDNGHTLLSLAILTATKSHPNYALIDELNHQMQVMQVTHDVVEGTFSSSYIVTSESDSSRGRLNSNDSDRSLQPGKENVVIETPKKMPTVKNHGRRRSKKRRYPDERSAAAVPNRNTTDVAASDLPEHLLLHFSRGSQKRSPEQSSTHLPAHPSQYAEV
jgi:hypothetical protein